MELVSSLGLDSTTYAEQIKEKWKEDESEDDDNNGEIEEEMEQAESEEGVEDVRKLVNGDGASTRTEKVQVPTALKIIILYFYFNLHSIRISEIFSFFFYPCIFVMLLQNLKCSL